MEDEQLIKDQLKNLPPELQQALEIVPWRSSIKEIALLNNLSIQQISLVDRETMLILYGFDDPKNYIDNLMREAGLDENTAVSIAEAVNEKILKKIADKADEFAKKSDASTFAPDKLVPSDLPMVEEGESAHTVPHDTKLDTMPKPAPAPAAAPETIVVPITKPQAAPTPEPAAPQAPSEPAAPLENAPAKPSPDTKLRPNSDTPAQKITPITPDYRYPGGKDPYREPLD